MPGAAIGISCLMSLFSYMRIISSVLVVGQSNYFGLLSFTSAYVRLVGQEPAPSKCVLMSTSAAVRRDMKDWVIFDQDERWTVKLDVRDLGGHLDTTYRA